MATIIQYSSGCLNKTVPIAYMGIEKSKGTTYLNKLYDFFWDGEFSRWYKLKLT